MRVKLLTFRYSATLGGFDDSPLQTFIRDKEVLSFREHFFQVDEVPHLSCIITYQDAIVPPDALAVAAEIKASMVANPANRNPTQSQHSHSSTFRRREAARPDPADGLDEAQRLLFNQLREWRARRAHDEGVPPYLLFTNRQLTELVVKRPESPTALGLVPGIGPAKVERYGAEILAMLRNQTNDPVPAPEPAASSTASSVS